MSENRSKNDSKVRLGGFLGRLLDGLGAMWVRRGAPMPKKDEKVTSITLSLGPHFGIFWVIFANLVLLGSCFWNVFVFASFGDSIFTVLGIIFECFFDAFFDCFFR